MVGKKISHYKILEKLGEGGMGVVYKAEDTKLERTVALKFLSLTSIGDEEKKRFKREAKAAASLNHPNIATIFVIDEADDQTFIAMEFIEGKSLQDIVGAQHAVPLPLDDAINYATQTAAGLQAAHEKGITHRDIKSANIMVTDKGQIKIMDFGLAKLANRSKLTQLGTTLGTAAYMSPEQSRGENTDHRSDIWSLGVVLYEMISGQLPFKGDYEQAVIYSIQNEEPEPLTALRSGVPIVLDGIIAKALAKDPKTRYQHVDELPADLKALDTDSLSKSRITTKPIVRAGRSKSNRQLKIFLPLAILTALAVGWFFSVVLNPSEEPALPLTSSLVFEEDAGPVPDRHLALSPDEAQLAYVTSIRFDGGRLWIRKLTDGRTRPLPGTEGAERPFWSPDGSMIGYFSEGELRVVPASGGPSVSLAPAPRPRGGTWNAKDVILYNPAAGPLFQISAAGGTPTQVTKQMPGTLTHRRPVFLPDGQNFLYWAVDTGDRGYVYMSDLKTGQIVRIREGGDPKYVDSGYLLFRLGEDIDVASIFAQRFDPSNGMLSGQPIPVLSDVATPEGNAALSVTNRTIVFVRDTQTPNRFWWRSSGEPADTLAHREYTWVYQVSHDGTRVAFAGQYLWIHDLVRRISERITTEVPFPIHFAWSQDDSRILYSSPLASAQLRVVQVAGTAKEEVIFQSDEGKIGSLEWSPDGLTILYVHLPDETRKHRELWAFDIEKSTASRLLKGYNIFSTQFAPNGQWYAYSSDEGGGGRDVYLRSFPGPGAPIRVSAGGGVWPRWRRDGKELFYVNRDGRLVSVRIEFEGRPSIQRAAILPDAVTANPYFHQVTPYDVHPDGQRFLLQQDWTMGDFSQLTILRDWVGMLEERP